MFDNLKDLKDTCDTANSLINRGKEPLEELKKLSNFIQHVHSDLKTNMLDKEDKEYKKFFFEDFTSGMLKKLTRERSRDEAVSIISIKRKKL